MAGKPTYEQLEQRIQELEARLRREKCRRLQEPLLQTLIDTIPCPLFYKDDQCRYQGGNHIWCEQIVGRPMDAIKNLTVYDLDVIPQPLKAKFHEQDMALLAHGGVQIYDAAVPCADGRSRTYRFHKAVYKEQNGLGRGIVGVMLDINELNRSRQYSLQKEQQLTEANQKLEDILFSMPYGIIMVDPHTHRIMEINPKAALMIGTPAENIVGKECHQFICPNERGRCPITDLKKPLECAETVLLTADSQQIPVIKNVIQTTIGDQPCLLESFIDISERKNAEMAHAEQEKLKAIIELAGAVCHELNQPLMVISGLAELLKMRTDDSPDYVDTHAGKILAQIDRIAGITQKLMNITRYTTKGYLNSRIVDLEKAAD